MSLLKFKLISNNNTEIEFESNYLLTENKLSFKNENTLYEYNIKDNLFVKKDNETSITIDINNSLIIINLLENNLAYDMDVEIEEFINKDNYISIKYIIKNEEDNITNNIIIDYK